VISDPLGEQVAPANRLRPRIAGHHGLHYGHFYRLPR
jgi:hypothetical protein